MRSMLLPSHTMEYWQPLVKEVQQDFDLVFVVDFLDVDHSKGDLSYVVAHTIGCPNSWIRLTREVSLHSTSRRTAIAILQIAIIALLRRNQYIITTDGRCNSTLAYAGIKVEQVGCITGQTSSEGGTLKTVRDVAEITKESRLVQEVPCSLVADRTF